MRARPAALSLASLLFLAACDAGEPAPTLQISGDTVVHSAVFDLPDGQQNVRCRYAFTAQLTGEGTDTATIRQGRVTFSFVATGLEHLTWEWTPERLAQLWENPQVVTGDTARSRHQDIGFSMPFRPVRGLAVFDYSVGSDDAVHSTEPFVFTCL